MMCEERSGCRERVCCDVRRQQTKEADAKRRCEACEEVIKMLNDILS